MYATRIGGWGDDLRISVWMAAISGRTHFPSQPETHSEIAPRMVRKNGRAVNHGTREPEKNGLRDGEASRRPEGWSNLEVELQCELNLTRGDYWRLRGCHKVRSRRTQASIRCTGIKVIHDVEELSSELHIQLLRDFGVLD